MIFDEASFLVESVWKAVSEGLVDGESLLWVQHFLEDRALP